jgi:hypothetical protein
VSDLNYVVKTPDRRKSRQLCHINMLKKYHDRVGVTEEKVEVKPIAVVTNELEVEEQIRGGEEIVPKLKNSEILRNLDKKLAHLSGSQRQELKELILEYTEIFPDVPSKTDIIEHDVDVGTARPIKQHPYRVNPLKRKKLKEEIDYMMENDIIEYSASGWSSPCLLVPKSDGTSRFVTDFRLINAVTKTDSFPIPRVEACIDQVGSCKYITKLDLLKGYWQVPLTERAREISALVTPDGLYQYRVMPFGMKNSAATFQRMVNKLIQDLEDVDGYIDDLIQHNHTWEEHMVGLRRLFGKLWDAKLTVNLGKSEFCKGTVQYLGHVVGNGQVRPVAAKVEAITNFPPPQNKKGIQRFLGMAGYYRKYCENFSSVVSPMTDLLKKNVHFKWDDKCQEAFEKVKGMLVKEPILVMPDFEKQFKLLVDASEIGAGAVLMQEQSTGIDHPVLYYSKKFNKHEKNYSTIEKECLALMLAIQQFEVYLNPTMYPVLVFTDHNPLVFINKMKKKNQRILRWSLILQEYDLEIRHIPGRYNVFADYLSR